MTPSHYSDLETIGALMATRPDVHTTASFLKEGTGSAGPHEHRLARSNRAIVGLWDPHRTLQLGIRNAVPHRFSTGQAAYFGV
jgi:hypothetical protein